MIVFYPGLVFWLAIGSALQAAAKVCSALESVTRKGK